MDKPLNVWRTSSQSNGQGQCVEVMELADGTRKIRDSKLGDSSPVLVFTPAEWDAFVLGAKDGEFDV